MTLLSYYDGRKKVHTRLAFALMIANGAIALAVACYWAGVSNVLEEPFRWATGQGVSPSPPPFEYPYLLLWLVPLVAMCLGWLSLKAKMVSFARFVGVYPLLFLGLMVGWYYVTPVHWH